MLVVTYPGRPGLLDPLDAVVAIIVGDVVGFVVDTDANTSSAD